MLLQLVWCFLSLACVAAFAMQNTERSNLLLSPHEHRCTLCAKSNDESNGNDKVSIGVGDDDPRTVDELLSELSVLTEAFESVQNKVQRNKALYEETIHALQSKISKLESEIGSSEHAIMDGNEGQTIKSDEQDGQSERIVDTYGSTSTESEANDAATDLTDQNEAIEKWKRETRILMKERDDLSDSIESLKSAIRNEADMMRKELRKEYIDMKAEVIKERDKAKKQSELAALELENERQKWLEERRAGGNENGDRISLRKVIARGWKWIRSKVWIRGSKGG